jgi:hypothetical protein
MRLVLVCSTLLLSAAAVSAQTASPTVKGTSPRIVILQAPQSFSCPLGFTADRLPGGRIEQVSPDASRPTLSFNVAVRSLNDRGIREATLIMHGIAGAQVIPAVGGDNADASESFALTPSKPEAHLIRAVVSPGKLTGVQWLELVDVTYADGSHWHQSSNSVCRIVPNNLLLVGATAQR